MDDFLESSIHGNTVAAWLLAIGVAVATFVALTLVRRILLARLSVAPAGDEPTWRSMLAGVVQRTATPFLLIVALYAGVSLLVLPAPAARIVDSVFAIAVILQLALWSSELTSAWVGRYAAQRAQESASVMNALSLIRLLARIAVWAFAFLLILENLGFDVTALIAGLGIGGIAIALAAQNILGDLFASLAIVLDKPFVVGDFVTFDGFMGTVENIGIKSTRLRSLSGEQIVVANTDLLMTRLRNFKRMAERRIVFSIGVVYQTPDDKLERIPAYLREIIEAREQVRFDRAHFQQFGDSALLFEVVYWVLSPDFNLYMDIQQAINLEIFRRFNEEGIEFAYPTQVLIVQRGDQAGLLEPAETAN